MSALAARKFVTLPLPSSPNCAPTMTTADKTRASSDGPRSGMSRRTDRCASALGRDAEKFTGVFAKSQADHAGRAVPLFRDDDLGLPLGLAVLYIVVVAVDERHQIGVLLNRPGFAQIRQHRPFVGAALHGAGELRERQHGHVKLPGQALQAARDLRDFLLAVLRPLTAGHELEIVDDDEAQRDPAMQ